MEPLPETVEAMDELDPMTTDDDLLERLVAASVQVSTLAPDCVGLSLTRREQDVTLTLVSSDAVVAELDAIQYVAGGPCVEAAAADVAVAVERDVMDERGWHLFADATAARGVASTLSLPLVEQGRVVGGINLYGATRDAFDGHHDEIANVFGSWARAAVTNADLSFSTRLAARRAPQHLRDIAMVDTANGLLAGRLDVEVAEARQRLGSAAVSAGVDLVVVARLVVQLLEP